MHVSSYDVALVSQDLTKSNAGGEESEGPNVMRHKIVDNVNCRLRVLNSERFCVQRTAWKTMYDGASSPTRVPPRSPVQYSLLDIPTASVRGRQVLDLLTVFLNILRCITLR